MLWRSLQEDQGSAAAEDDDVIDVAAQEAEKQRLALIEVERELDRRAQEAVLAGLQQAKQQVLGAEEEEAAATAAAVAAAVLAPAAEAAPAAAAPTAEPPAQQEQQQHDSSGGAAVAAEAASEPAAAAADKAEKKAEGEAENEVEDAEARAAAEDAAKYPPLIFEPGSLDKIGSDAPPVLQVRSLCCTERGVWNVPCHAVSPEDVFKWVYGIGLHRRHAAAKVPRPWQTLRCRACRTSSWRQRCGGARRRWQHCRACRMSSWRRPCGSASSSSSSEGRRQLEARRNWSAGEGAPCQMLASLGSSLFPLSQSLLNFLGLCLAPNHSLRWRAAGFLAYMALPA